MITDGVSIHGGGYGGGGYGMITTYAPGLFPTFAPAKIESGQLQTVSRVRTEFPETWLWSSATVGYVRGSL